MDKTEKSYKLDILELLRILRGEYDSDDPVYKIVTGAIREIESLRMQNQDLRAAQRNNHR